MKKRRFLSIFITITMLISLTPVFNQKAEAAILVTKPQIFTKGQQTVALKADGTVWAWGCNLSGELGDGTNISKNTPVQVKGLTGVVSITAGFDHTAALKEDGTVWTWGSNYYGQLGNGEVTNTGINIPVQVKGLTGIVSIAAGEHHTVALKADGTVWAWGWNYYGELGDGTNTDTNKPVQVKEINRIKTIAAGYFSTIAIKEDGTVWAWGENYYGNLGDGTNTDKNIPIQVKGLSGAVSIVGGCFDTAALKEDGTVWSWGINYYGQLGDGTNIDRNMPVQVKNISGVVSIAAGASHTAAIKEDGTVWAWGRNDYGQLGDETNTNKNIPVQVKGLSGTASISGGWMHTAALKKDGTVWSWGKNYYGELGDGTNLDKNIPVQTPINLKNPSITSNDFVYNNNKGIIVCDYTTHKPIADASVALGDNSVTTDSKGFAEFDNEASGKYNLKISKSGYCDYIIDNYNFIQSKTDTLFLKENNDTSKPYVSSAILSDPTNNSEIDIISQNKDYKIEKDGSGNIISTDSCSIRIKAAGYSASTPNEYMLMQDGKTIQSNSTGVFDNIIPAKLFKADIPIWVMVKYEDGKSTPAVKTQINIFESPFNPYQNFKVKLGTKIGVTIPNDIPFFGGKELSYGFDAIEASAEFGKDTFKIGLGIKDLTNIKDNWDDFKSIINTPRSDEIISGALKGQFNTSDGVGFSLLNGIKGDCNALGYIEGKVVGGKLVPTEGKIRVKLGLKTSTENQYYLPPVGLPAVVTIEIGANAKFDGDITYDYTKQAISINSEVTLTMPHLEVSGGIGFAYAANVRAYGSGDMKFLNDFTNNYYKASITASAGIKAKFLAYEYKQEWLKETYVLFDGYNTQNTQSIQTVQDSKPLNIYDKSIYSLASRDYIKNPSVWMLNLNKPSLVQGSYANQEIIKTLQTNIYPDAEPMMAVLGDKLVMVWLADNAARSPMNRTMLVYLVYDKSAGTWSAPQAVNDDQTADFYPSITSDGNNLYVAWQNSKQVLSDSVTIDEMAANGEIETAKFNSGSNTFEAPKVYTNNSTLDTQPQVTADNGKAAVVWTSNSSNDIFGTSGLNTIYYSELNDTEWSAPAVLTDNQKSVTGLSVGYLDGNLTTVFAADGDNDLTTILDREIYVVKQGQTVQRLTDNQVLDSNPVFGMFNGQKTLYWYSDGNIKYLSDLSASPSTVFSTPVTGLTDDFKIVNNSSGKTAIIWTKNENESAEIHSSIYDTTKSAWSDDVKITDVGADVRYPDGIFDDSGSFLIAFNRVTKTDTSEQSDLCTVSVMPSYNLTADNVLYDDTKVVPNGTLPVEIQLTNKGELGVDNINVEVLDGTNVISSAAVQQTIKPGESSVINSSFVLPASISKKTYTIKVTPVNGTEYDLTDNSKDITVGYTDLGLTVNQYFAGDKQMAAVTVSNSSYIPSSAVLKIRENTPDGNVLAEKTIDSLAYGENAVNIFEIDPVSLNYTDDTKALYFTLESAQEELRTGDNSNYITVNKPKSSIITASLIENEQSGSSYDIIGDFKNNTPYTMAAKAVFAIYGDNEKLLDIKIVDLNLEADGETQLEQILTTSEKVVGTKVFVLEDLNNLNPLSNLSDADITQSITKPDVLIGGKSGASGKYGSDLLNDVNAAVNGNGTIGLTINQGQNPQQLTYTVLPFKDDASDSSDGYGTSQEIQDSAAAFGIFTASGISSKTVNLKANTKSGEYLIKISGGNGINDTAEYDVLRYVYTYKSFDTNSDGTIDIMDIASAAALYNTKSTDSLYNKYMDLNSDNVVNIYDLIQISKRLN